jgi:hypothetical protein
MLLGRREHGRHGPCSRQVTIRKRSNEEVRTSQLAGCPPDRRLSAVWTSLQWRRTPDHRASLMGLQSRARDPDTVSPKRRRALRLGGFFATMCCSRGSTQFRDRRGQSVSRAGIPSVCGPRHRTAVRAAIRFPTDAVTARACPDLRGSAVRSRYQGCSTGTLLACLPRPCVS